MSENEANEAINASESKIGYAEIVKGTVLAALASGKSVLQKDRAGIDYSLNASSGTVYTGMNQLFLQQRRENEGFKNPHWMTFQQIRDKGFFPAKDEKGSIISYYASTMRYHRDEYPLGPDGIPDKTKPILHRKGEPRLNDKGQTYGGNEYNYVWNLGSQVNLEYKQFRNNTHVDQETGERRGGYVVASNALVINNDVKLNNPFPATATKGSHYQAKDDSIIEKFAEDVSKYFNSIYTGEKFSGVKYSPEEIKTLQKEITSRTSPIFQKINDAALIAAGQTEKLDRIENRRNEKQQAQQPETQEKSRGRGGR